MADLIVLLHFAFVVVRRARRAARAALAADRVAAHAGGHLGRAHRVHRLDLSVDAARKSTAARAANPAYRRGFHRPLHPARAVSRWPDQARSAGAGSRSARLQPRHLRVRSSPSIADRHERHMIVPPMMLGFQGWPQSARTAALLSSGHRASPMCSGRSAKYMSLRASGRVRAANREPLDRCRLVEAVARRVPFWSLLVGIYIAAGFWILPAQLRDRARQGAVCRRQRRR